MAAVPWLIGRAGYAFFDYWFIIHLSFWLVVASSCAAFKFDRSRTFLECWCISFAWELFERFAEPAWPKIWQSPESWWNAGLSDPGTVLLGFVIAFYGYDRWREPKRNMLS